MTLQRKGQSGTHSHLRRAGAAAALALLGIAAACSTIGIDPAEPAAIEMAPLPAPAIVIGDSLRDANGVAMPVRAIVRNIRGEIITDAPVTYVYAEYNRDSALIVDPVSGYVTAVKEPAGEARLAARVGTALQVLRPIRVTLRPDSIDREGQPAIVELVTTLPDTNRTSAQANTSVGLNVVVRHVREDETTAPVRSWLVRYSLVMPANGTNDSTAAVFLVNEAGLASSIDTTDATGIATRFVRVRAALFPAGTEPDSVVVEASASYRGVPLRGAPVRMTVPVRRGTPAAAAARQ